MRILRSPKSWFGGRPPLALVTEPFPGEMPGQLYYPSKHNFVYRPVKRSRPNCMPQEDDKGKVVIIYGPSFCPWSYLFLRSPGKR